MFDIAINTENLLGECPLWCEKTHRLYWTDIMGSELLAVDPQTGASRRWAMPERLGSFALTGQDNILLLGLESQLASFNLDTGKLAPIAPSPGAAETRIGDGRCDRLGNFVFGTIHEGVPQAPVGAFYRLNAGDLTVEQLALPEAIITNSICFSPDGATMYYCDSLQKRIFCCDYPSLENQRVFVDVQGGGAPDGSCIDAQGCLWNAEWGGARVVRYAPDGREDRVIAAPARQTTCPVLGGSAGDTLFCTSARVGLVDAQPADGALLAVRLSDVKGLPESRFFL